MTWMWISAIVLLLGAEVNEFRRAFGILPVEQREALVLVGAEGFSYE